MRISYPYTEVLEYPEVLPAELTLIDHLGGFHSDYSNQVLHTLSKQRRTFDIVWHEIAAPEIADRYPNLRLVFSAKLQDVMNLNHFKYYRTHPEIKIQHFVASLNGTPHVSRKLLVAILHRFGLFDSEVCSKNFSFTPAIIDGHLRDYVDENRFKLIKHFFIGTDCQSFFQTINSFDYTRFDHQNNVYSVEQKITSSFLHLVSETLATSYQPFVTEKFLYSVVTRGLFLAYAQPGWHHHLEKYYGFRKYRNIFDYRFDSIRNPVERLIELMSMLTKFSVLPPADLHDLYNMESETIEYNYDWYFSKNYMKHLEQFC